MIWSFESLSEKNYYLRSKPYHWISTCCMACFAKMWLMWGWQEGEAKLILVSLISNTAPSKKPSCSKVSPDVNLLIAWFPSPPLIHWSNLSSDLYKEKKNTCFLICSRNSYVGSLPLTIWGVWVNTWQNGRGRYLSLAWREILCLFARENIWSCCNDFSFNWNAKILSFYYPFIVDNHSTCSLSTNVQLIYNQGSSSFFLLFSFNHLPNSRIVPEWFIYPFLWSRLFLKCLFCVCLSLISRHRSAWWLPFSNNCLKCERPLYGNSVT